MINNETIKTIDALVKEGKDTEAKNALFNAAREAGFDVKKERDYTEMRDQFLAAQDKLKKLGDNPDELARLAALGRDYESKNKTAEQLLADLKKQNEQLAAERDGLKQTHEQTKKEMDTFLTGQIDTMFTDIDPAKKETILSKVKDLPLRTQAELIPLMINTAGTPGGTPPPNVPPPGQRKQQGTRHSEDDINMYLRTWAKDGITRQDIIDFLDGKISLAQKKQEIQRSRK